MNAVVRVLVELFWARTARVRIAKVNGDEQILVESCEIVAMNPLRLSHRVKRRGALIMHISRLLRKYLRRGILCLLFPRPPFLFLLLQFCNSNVVL